MKALLPVATGNEEIEFCALVDVLRRARIDVTVASVQACEMVVLQQGLNIVPDAKLEDVANEAWDAIVMPGGVPGAMNLGASELLKSIIQRHHTNGGLLGAICLSPALVLKPAGVLEHAKKVTGNPLAIKTPDQTWPADAFTQLLGDTFDSSLRVCVDRDNNIVTSQTPGTAIEYALAIVELLRGKEVASKISDYFLVKM
ncbi:DJ-1/PfpI family protein [Planctomycetaceae bacterium]|nr:DJ-1/PfpI family protein [Planctomycetaceae bacterium]